MIFERTRFNRRVQQSGETAEDFIVAVHSMADKCNFGTMKNELIRDRLVAGIQDSDLSERLQLNAGLTLSDAIKAIRQHEAVHESQKELRLGDSKETPIVVDTVQRRAQQSSCQRCGRDHQRRELSMQLDAIHIERSVCITYLSGFNCIFHLKYSTLRREGTDPSAVSGIT